MKIAVCLSGHLRTFDANYESWETHLFSKYDCDTFLHTWDVTGNKIGDGDVNVTEQLDSIGVTPQELKQKYNFTDVTIQSYTEPLQ